MNIEFIKRGMSVTPKVCLMTSEALIDDVFYPRRIVVPGEVLTVESYNRTTFGRPVRCKTKSGEIALAYFSEIKLA